jgi:putative FmdB family regulatory protein
MPIYEYECRKCKSHVEVLQKISDKPLTKCAKCGGTLEKQWSNTSFQFKGSGWYVTDYAGKKADASDEKKSSNAEPVATTETTTTTAATETGSSSGDNNSSNNSTATKNAPKEKSNGKKASTTKASSAKE